MFNKFSAVLAAAMITCAVATSAFAAGAIAVDDEQGMAAEDAGYGVGYGGNRREAERNAMRECKSAGNEGCKVVVTFEECAAYVGNKSHYATGTGSTLKAAEREALDACPRCKLIVSDCH